MRRPEPFAVFCLTNSMPKVPHLLRDVDPETKISCKNFYRKVKKGIIIGSISGICIYEAGQLVCDIVKSKLILREYKYLFLRSIGPALEVGATIIYIVINAKKARQITKNIAEIGVSIWRGQQEITNIAFFVIDIALFGEPVLITDNTPLSIFGNETNSSIDEFITTLSDN